MQHMGKLNNVDHANISLLLTHDKRFEFSYVVEAVRLFEKPSYAPRLVEFGIV